MKRLLTFETFVPKKMAGRDAEAEAKGVINYIRMAKQGKFTALEWETGKHLINIDFDTAEDPRVCCYAAYYPPIDDYIYMYLVREYPIYWQTNNGPYLLTIMDDNGLQFKQPFTTFEAGVEAMTAYLGCEPEVFTV